MSSVPSIRPFAGSLEDELGGLLHALGLDERQAGAVAARLGWDGSGTRTLELAAAPFGYTRERVRQLEARVRGAAAGWPVPAVGHALTIVEEAAPDTCGQIGALLAERGLAEGAFDPSGVLTAAQVLGLESSVRVAGGAVVARDDDPRAKLRRRAKKLAQARGAANTNELALELRLSPPRVRRLLELSPEVQWLDERRTWAALTTPSPFRRTATILRKMLSVAPRLSFADADAGLRRSFRPVSLPAAVQHDVFHELPWLDVDVSGRTIGTTIELDPARELSRIEQLLYGLFVDAGRPLRYIEVVTEGAPRGLNRNTVGYYLRHAPIFTMVNRGTYALCRSAATASSSRS